MAKRGLVYWFVMGLGVNMVGYLFYLQIKTYPLVEDKSALDYYKRMEQKEVILTEKQIRMQSERTINEKVPETDTDEGYM